MWIFALPEMTHLLDIWLTLTSQHSLYFLLPMIQLLTLSLFLHLLEPFQFLFSFLKWVH
jgi:hypothetical protein